MNETCLSIACQNSDRTRPLIDGRVRVEGVDLRWIPVDPEEIFHRAFRNQEFDICEISLSTHLTMTGRGGSPYVGVPAFLSRAFRHSAIFVKAGSEIRYPGDLRGKRVGVPDYQQTAGLWARGMLNDEYGVPPESIQWLVGGLEQAGREPRTKIEFSDRFLISSIAADQTLSSMLRTGELDAIISPRVPSGNVGEIARLFPDYRRAEEAYFLKTGLFPLMHAVGVRKDVDQRYPWLAASLLKAFTEAKLICEKEMQLVNYMRATLPWLSDDVARVQAVMGRDYWKYGIAENRPELEAMTKYAFMDGLTPRQVEIGELFSPATESIFKL
jgi:4,5-dihydroxyphthalate decarboxylase